MQAYNKLYREYLERYVDEADDWEVCNEENWENEERENAYKVNAKINSLLKLTLIQHPKSDVHSISFTGGLGGRTDEYSHYDIDKALVENFGNKVTTDSKSSQFWAYCKPEVQEEVTNYLNENFPQLMIAETRDLREQDENCDCIFGSVPGAGNWDRARKTLKKMEGK